MQLHRLEYWQHVNTPDEWRILPFRLSQTNLVVGRNATGKSRVLQVIRSLARLVKGDFGSLQEGNWSTEFEHGGRQFTYDLQITGGRVEREQFREHMGILLERGSDGSGLVKAEETCVNQLKFRVPETMLATVAK